MLLYQLLCRAKLKVWKTFSKNAEGCRDGSAETRYRNGARQVIKRLHKQSIPTSFIYLKLFASLAMRLLGTSMCGKSRCRDQVVCVVFLVLQSLHLSIFWENVFHTCLCTFFLHTGTLKEDVVLASLFQNPTNISVIRGTTATSQCQIYGG